MCNEDFIAKRETNGKIKITMYCIGAKLAGHSGYWFKYGNDKIIFPIKLVFLRLP